MIFLTKVKYEDGFMNDKALINKKVTLISIYNQFNKTGRFDALDCKPRTNKSHIFWDSDAAKWLESVSLALVSCKDKKLYKLADEVINKICKYQRKDGYYNSYFSMKLGNFMMKKHFYFNFISFNWMLK